MGDSLENVMYRCIERFMNGRRTEHHGLVTTYDSKNYLAKIKLMPEGQETGWLPIETGHIGQGYGIAMGLQPGSGGSSQWGQDTSGSSMGQTGGSQDQQQQNDQALGDQVIVRFQETDIESGKVAQCVHSEKDKPPGEVKSGEIMMWTKFKKDKDSGPDAAKDGTGGTGCKMYFKNDGSLTTEDGNGASRTMDGNGNYTVTSGNKQKDTKILHQIVQNNPSIVDQQQSSGSKPVHYSSLAKKAGAKVSVFNEQHFTSWDQGGVTHSSSSNVTSKAPSIPHIGNTSVSQGNLTVSQIVSASSYTTTSDARLKENIAPLPPTLSDVMRLEVKTFDKHLVDLETNKRAATAPRRSLGLVAQQAREVFPDLVEGDEDREFLSLSESKAAMILLAAFQEFVTETRREIDALKARLNV